MLHGVWTKIRNFDEILDEIGDFGPTKKDILDNVFLCCWLHNTELVYELVYRPAS